MLESLEVCLVVNSEFLSNWNLKRNQSPSFLPRNRLLSRTQLFRVPFSLLPLSFSYTNDHPSLPPLLLDLLPVFILASSRRSSLFGVANFGPNYVVGLIGWTICYVDLLFFFFCRHCCAS